MPMIFFCDRLAAYFSWGCGAFVRQGPRLQWRAHWWPYSHDHLAPTGRSKCRKRFVFGSIRIGSLSCDSRLLLRFQSKTPCCSKFEKSFHVHCMQKNSTAWSAMKKLLRVMCLGVFCLLWQARNDMICLQDALATRQAKKLVFVCWLLRCAVPSAGPVTTLSFKVDGSRSFGQYLCNARGFDRHGTLLRGYFRRYCVFSSIYAAIPSAICLNRFFLRHCTFMNRNRCSSEGPFRAHLWCPPCSLSRWNFVRQWFWVQGWQGHRIQRNDRKKVNFHPTKCRTHHRHFL